MDRLGRWLMAGAVFFMLAGCEGVVDETAEPITILGSSTVFTFAQKVAADLVVANEGFTAPDISSTGSSEGIAQFCQGQGPETADIVNASRRMTVAEFTRCQNAGVTRIIEIKVGRDGIVFAAALEKGFDFDLTPDAVYRALAASGGLEASDCRRGEEVTRRADAGDAMADEAIELFLTYLGRLAGDLALLFLPKGGVYVAGGIAPRLTERFEKSGFRAAFEAKQPHVSLLEDIPTFVVTAPRPALAGLAAFAIMPERFAVDLSGRRFEA